MLQETRMILFAKDDLTEALNSYRRANPDFLPAGDLTIKSVSRNGGLKVIIQMSYGDNSQEAEFDLTPESIRASLIRACCENNIKIPIKGSKSVVATNKGVALRITLPAGEFDAHCEIERVASTIPPR